ncbi:YjbH domain-containing protein, partial [Planktomarina temperata]|nr:YjbH domain-containing protein [Planktomarina temperata]
MKLFWAALSGVLCTAHISFAEPRVTYNAYGMPGLVDMPSAQSAPDAELSFSVSQSGESLRNTLTFQIAPRLTGPFATHLSKGHKEHSTTDLLICATGCLTKRISGP